VPSFTVGCSVHVAGHEIDPGRLLAEVPQSGERNVDVARVSRQPDQPSGA
jgi:hypothetical protein